MKGCLLYHHVVQLIGNEIKWFVHMPAIEQSELADLVRETRQRLKLLQGKFAARLGVAFQSVNRWDRRTKPLPVALKQIEQLLLQMGDRGKDLLAKYFSG